MDELELVELASCRMKVIAALLCDAASIRESLLSVLGAGITHLRREEFPTALSSFFAGLIEYDASDVESDHYIEVRIARVEGAEEVEVVNVRGELERLEQTALPNSVATLPFAVDLQSAEIDAPGDYYIAVKIDGAEGMRVRFTATQVSNS
ncbi:hypothetical protein CBR64_20505 [Cellulosimicrobium cellulans]|uniref:Uncharacterized protein n=1 Tax=Cellulosimicrobium cellulans TaxID=1710 RepID=A0A1Y0HZ17_CELCE|nr:hypothetical protein [Cellulosimicrobium cellulans]ARU53458.1 hypothetical protein CBR64_20505 [Cellulosimicrobium cellulans]